MDGRWLALGSALAAAGAAALRGDRGSSLRSISPQVFFVDLDGALGYAVVSRPSGPDTRVAFVRWDNNHWSLVEPTKSRPAVDLMPNDGVQIYYENDSAGNFTKYGTLFRSREAFRLHLTKHREFVMKESIADRILSFMDDWLQGQRGSRLRAVKPPRKGHPLTEKFAVWFPSDDQEFGFVILDRRDFKTSDPTTIPGHEPKGFETWKAHTLTGGRAVAVNYDDEKKRWAPLEPLSHVEFQWWQYSGHDATLKFKRKGRLRSRASSASPGRLSTSHHLEGRPFFTDDLVDLGDMESFYSSGGGDLLDQIEIWLLVNSSKKSGSPLKAVIPGPEPDPFDVGKITKKDYRTRIRPGFYRRGNDYLRYDEVFPVGPRRHKGAPLDASNWYVSVTGPLTGGTPGQGTPAAAGNHYPVWQLISAGWRRVDKAKLPAAWKDWFDKNPPR